MVHDNLRRFIEAKSENSQFIEEKIFNNISNHKKILSRYLTSILTISIIYFVLEEDSNVGFSFLGLGFTPIVITRFMIPFILTIILLFYTNALSFKKDLESCYRYVFALNHNLAFEGDLYKPHRNDEITRLTLPFGASSEMFRFSGRKWINIFKRIFLGFPALLCVFTPVYIIISEFNVLLSIQNKSAQEYVFLFILGSGILAGMYYFIEYQSKVLDLESNQKKNL